MTQFFKLFLISIFISNSFSAFSQQNTKAKLSGTVIDRTI